MAGNSKAAATKADRYTPKINETYAKLAAHYQTALFAGTPLQPQDKAKAEAAVLLVEHWILGRLRHRMFFSLAELNSAIAELMPVLNQRPFRVRSDSLFEALDRPTLRPLRQHTTSMPSGARHDRALTPHRDRQATVQRA